MTKFLLSCMLASVAASGFAAEQPSMVTRHLDKMKNSRQLAPAKGDKILSSKQLAKGIQLLTVKDAEGRVSKRLRTTSGNSIINPMAKMPAKTAAPGKVLFEDFEEWDGEDPSWLPEGFSLKHESGREEAKGWDMASESSFGGFMGGLTGNCLSIIYDSEYLDEWVVFPEVTLGEDMILSFNTFNDGVWYFSMDNVDWDTMQYVGEKTKAYDQQIMISEDGGENWTLLKSLAEDFMGINDFNELLTEGINGLRPVNVSLSEYSGKTVKIAYRYIGKDGNTSCIDNISIGYPAMDLSYMNPTGTLYFGMSHDAYTLNYSILTGPVYSPMSFMNMSYADGAKYSWKYMNADSEWDTADTQDALDVEYRTDYTSDFTTRNNWFYTPVLYGTAPGYSDGEYTRGQYLQAGGKAEFEATTSDGNKILLDLGLGVIDPSTEGSALFTDQLTPIFGYSGDSDSYWTNYTFGEEADENNYVHLDGYMDFFYTSATPIVIKGIHAPAYAKLNKGAQMKAEIVALSDEGAVMDEPIATAICKYEDMTILETGGTTDFVSLNFKFDEPVVMSSDVCMAYVVRISGFRDPEHVEYFNPLMSETSNPDNYALGWIQKSIVMDGNDPRVSMTPVVNYTEDVMVAFYIMLDAEFPWLEGPDEVEMTEPVMTVNFDSSVDGENLKFENMPEWLSATATGRLGDTKVTFSIPLTDELKGDATVTVTGPGVSHDILVKADKANSVDGISAESGADMIFNLSGNRVSNMNDAGIYIVKDATGKACKKIVK